MRETRPAPFDTTTVAPTPANRPEILTNTLHFTVHAGNGPPMLLVHGMLSSSVQWAPNLEALSRVCRPITVDLLGHGRSPAPTDDASYGVTAYLAAFEQIRQKLGAPRWFMCGQSFGAGLTLQYAVAHPAHVIGQVLTNSRSALAEPGELANAPERAPLLAALEAGQREPIADLPFHPRHATRLPAEMKHALNQAAQSVDPQALARSLRVTLAQSSARDVVARTNCPTLLVNGRRESKFQPYRDLAARIIPGCRIVDLDAGHAVNIEAAAAFNDAVLDFFADTDRN